MKLLAGKCAEPTCNARPGGRGYCPTHHRVALVDGRLERRQGPRKTGSVKCPEPGCGRETHARGYCKGHYQVRLASGQLTARIRRPARKTPMQRWAAFVQLPEKPSGCWQWTGHLTSVGYGGLWLNGKMDLAHRYSYQRFVGEIPADKELDHICRNRACVNPEHLEAVTDRENSRRGIGPAGVNARKTHCNYGHAFTPENTARLKSGNRRCRACEREKASKKRQVYTAPKHVTKEGE